jgi:hypothetical protein
MDVLLLEASALPKAAPLKESTLWTDAWRFGGFRPTLVTELKFEGRFTPRFCYEAISKPNPVFCPECGAPFSISPVIGAIDFPRYLTCDCRLVLATQIAVYRARLPLLDADEGARLFGEFLPIRKSPKPNFCIPENPAYYTYDPKRPSPNPIVDYVRERMFYEKQSSAIDETLYVSEALALARRQGLQHPVDEGGKESVFIPYDGIFNFDSRINQSEAPTQYPFVYLAEGYAQVFRGGQVIHYHQRVLVPKKAKKKYLEFLVGFKAKAALAASLGQTVGQRDDDTPVLEIPPTAPLTSSTETVLRWSNCHTYTLPIVLEDRTNPDTLRILWDAFSKWRPYTVKRDAEGNPLPLPKQSQPSRKVERFDSLRERSRKIVKLLALNDHTATNSTEDHAPVTIKQALEMWRDEEDNHWLQKGRQNARPEWFVKEKSYWYDRVIQKFNFSHLSPDNQLGRGKAKPQPAQYKFRMVNDNCSDQEIVRQIIENVTQQLESFAKVKREEAFPERNTRRARIYSNFIKGNTEYIPTTANAYRIVKLINSRFNGRLTEANLNFAAKELKTALTAERNNSTAYRMCTSHFNFEESLEYASGNRGDANAPVAADSIPFGFGCWFKDGRTPHLLLTDTPAEIGAFSSAPNFPVCAECDLRNEKTPAEIECWLAEHKNELGSALVSDNPNACPECQSTAHTRGKGIDEWVCADCQHHWIPEDAPLEEAPLEEVSEDIDCDEPKDEASDEDLQEHPSENEADEIPVDDSLYDPENDPSDVTYQSQTGHTYIADGYQEKKTRIGNRRDPEIVWDRSIRILRRLYPKRYVNGQVSFNPTAERLLPRLYKYRQRDYTADQIAKDEGSGVTAVAVSNDIKRFEERVARLVQMGAGDAYGHCSLSDAANFVEMPLQLLTSWIDAKQFRATSVDLKSDGFPYYTPGWMVSLKQLETLLVKWEKYLKNTPETAPNLVV